MLVVIIVVTGLDCLLVTVAVLVMVPIFWGLMVIVMTAEVSGSSIPKLQVTLPASWLQPVDEMKSTSGGRVSVTITSVAGSGPRFMTVIW